MITLFTLDSVKADEAFEYNNALSDIVMDYQGGEFSLFFANCEAQSAVSFDLQVRNGALILQCALLPGLLCPRACSTASPCAGVAVQC